MATQQLIYNSIVPVTQARHGKRSIEAGTDFAFSRKVNSVPITSVEFLQTAAEYPIVFTGEGGTPNPAVILGVREGENVYLDSRGGWTARYIPAFVRRYPFIFFTGDGGKTFALCIDESFPGLNEQGLGQRLFDDQGTPTLYVEEVLRFLKQYQLEMQRTESFCTRLMELNLLVPMQAQVDVGASTRISLTGFMVVDREALKALPPQTLSELARTDALELVYAHLHSMRHFAAIRERTIAPSAAAAGAANAASALPPAREQERDQKGRNSGTDSAPKSSRAPMPEKDSPGIGRKR